MPTPAPRNPTRVGPDKCSVAEAQDTDFNITNMNMLKDLKENKNKSLIEVCRDTNSGNKMLKTLQDMKIGTESLKKTQTKVKLEMKM